MLGLFERWLCQDFCLSGIGYCADLLRACLWARAFEQIQVPVQAP